jgi:hypothetical protein
MTLDTKKIRQFMESSLKDYKNNLLIDKICNIIIVEETDRTFTQIGVRPLVDEDMLLSDKNGVCFLPELPGVGQVIADGERDFLIKKILEVNKIKKIEKLEDFP